MKARVYLPAVSSAVLLWCAFFPLNLGPLAFVALVPFLSLIRAEGVGRWRRYTAAWVGGLVFGALCFNWVRHAHPMMMLFAWPGLTLFQSFFWPIALFLLRRLDRLGQPPLALTVPVVWVGLEFIRAHFPTGFEFLRVLGLHQYAGVAWYYLGHTQHANLPLLQAADLGGAYLVSAAVGSVNGAMYGWFLRMRFFRWFINVPRVWQLPVFHKEMLHTAWAFCFTGLLMGYGGYQMIHKPFETGPNVAVIQESVPQNEKMGDETNLFNIHNKLCEQAVVLDPKPDLVIWPETCYPFTDVTIRNVNDIKDLDNEARYYYLLQEGRLRPFLQDNKPKGRVDPLIDVGRSAFAARYWRTNVLLGLPALECDGSTVTRFNSARLIYPDGGVGPRYDKRHLVPFGEYVPWRQTIPFMKNFTPYGDRDYSCTPGKDFTRFEIDVLKSKRFRSGKEIADDKPESVEKPVTYSFGVLICYEDSDPYFARQYNPSAGRGPGVDFLVNISNDGWFQASEEHEQHLAISRFRAVEARRTVLRAVNMGISAAIDPDGRIIQLPRLLDEGWAASKGVAGTLNVDVPMDSRGSLYALLGDWVPLLCWIGIVCGLLGRRLNKWFGKKPNLGEPATSVAG